VDFYWYHFLRFCLEVGVGVKINLNCRRVVGHEVWGLFIPIHPWDLDIADSLTILVGKNKLFRLILAEVIDSGNDCVGHGYGIPAAPHNLFHGLQGHEFKTALHVATGAKADRTLHVRELAVLGLVLFVLRGPGNTAQVVGADDGFWADGVQNASFYWEVIQ
jgi:hypothetical protein